MGSSIDEKLSIVTVVIILLLALPILAYLLMSFVFVPPIVGSWKGSLDYTGPPEAQVDMNFVFSGDGNCNISMTTYVLTEDYYVPRMAYKAAKWKQNGSDYYVFYDNESIKVYLQNENSQIYLPDNMENGNASPFRGWLKRERP